MICHDCKHDAGEEEGMRRKPTCWATLLTYAREEAKDETPTVACTLTDKEMLVEFDNGYGGTEGKPFTAWSETRVYFPVCYDGAEWVGSAPRNPCAEATEHIGG